MGRRGGRSEWAGGVAEEWAGVGRRGGRSEWAGGVAGVSGQEG